MKGSLFMRSNLNSDWLSKLPLDNISSARPVSGGDINLAYQIKSSDSRYFLKVQPNHPSDYFDHERAGLTALGDVVNALQPISQGEINGDAYLLLNWIDTGQGSQHDLGKMVAILHQHHNQQFGFDFNHQSGNLTKNNQWQNSWVTFYTEQRLDMLASASADNHVWNSWRQTHFDQMRQQFINYYNNHPVEPSLLHGDLWSGNYMFSGDGQPVLIDPDAFYGDRELDLAMTTIFGGFSQEFYQAYEEQYPIPSGLEDRLPWYQFYYLCMHLNLFGESYGDSVDRILSNY